MHPKLPATRRTPSAPMATQGLPAPPLEALSAAELRALATAIAEEFPLSAPPMDSIMLLEVDPRRLHAFWALDAKQLARVRSDAADDSQRLVLRIRQVAIAQDGDDPRSLLPSFDQAIVAGQTDCEIQVPEAGRCYQAELALAGANGRWVSLARSNLARAPALGPAPELAARMLDVAKLTSPVAATAGSARDAAALAMDPSLKAGSADALQPIFPNTQPSCARSDERWPSRAVAVPQRPIDCARAEPRPVAGSSSSSTLSSGTLALDAPRHGRS